MTFPTAALPYTVSASFGGTQLSPVGPNEVKVTQQEFMHDMAVMQIWADDVNSDSYTSGMPMTLTFGRPDLKRIFYGYVNHVSRVNNSMTSATMANRNAVWITCMGASWYMQQTGTQVFRSQTASQIVSTIAQQFGLATNIVAHTTIWPTMQMAGMSYWQFCVMLAKRIGYTFYCSGAQLVFKPRQTDSSNVTGLVATYDYKTNPGSLPVFTPVLGATSPSGGQLANRKLAGINAQTNQIVYSNVSGNPAPTTLGNTINNPVFDKTEHFTVGTQQEAATKAAGAGQLNQLYLTAEAQSVGAPLISQGSLIYVLNANGSQNGLWFVQKAVHRLNTSTYTTDFNVGRDSLGQSVVTPSGTITTTQLPVAVLVNNKWVAQ